MIALLLGPLGRYLLLVGAFAALLGGVYAWGEHAGRRDVQGRWDRERLQQVAAAASASEAARLEEQRRAAAQQEIVDESVRIQARVVADAAAARDAAGGLRERVAAVAARCGASAPDPAASAPGPAASSPGDLLADVFGRLVVRAGELAVVADQRGAAGSACERAYDSLRGGAP